MKKITAARTAELNLKIAELKEEVVFVGGATVMLYVDKNIADEARPTEDIDILVEILHYGKSYDKLVESLLKLGFQPDTESKVICRYIYQGITVDVSVTDGAGQSLPVPSAG